MSDTERDPLVVNIAMDREDRCIMAKHGSILDNACAKAVADGYVELLRNYPLCKVYQLKEDGPKEEQLACGCIGHCECGEERVTVDMSTAEGVRQQPSPSLPSASGDRGDGGRTENEGGPHGREVFETTPTRTHDVHRPRMDRKNQRDGRDPVRQGRGRGEGRGGGHHGHAQIVL